jgi:hypothetical protein
MKQQLHDLYLQKQPAFQALRQQFPTADLAGPLLLSPNAAYSKQKYPLLIIGQETKGWQYHVQDIAKQMAVYEEFNVGETYYASPFWNVTRKVERALGSVPYSCSWTNVSKFDLDGGRSYGQYEQAISDLDDILTTEISILQPEVCIFFTGPDFDYRLNRIFTGLRYNAVSDWNKRALARLEHPLLPPHCFRTYHPRYLRLRRQETAFIETIAGLVL